MDTYTVIGHPIETTGIHPELGHVTEGMKVKARHDESGAIAEVFVPHENYSAENVDTQLRHKFGKHHQVMALGRTEPTQG